MGLKDIQIARETISTGQKDDRGEDISLVVRGLSSVDIAVIFARHQGAVETFYSRAVLEQGSESVSSDFAALATGMMSEAPALLGLLIAVAVDEPDQHEIAGALPVGVQAELLEAIFRLTLIREGGLGKLLETGGRILRTMTPQKSPLVSRTGSPSSAKR